jgi:hypothetical protein
VSSFRWLLRQLIFVLDELFGKLAGAFTYEGGNIPEYRSGFLLYGVVLLDRWL